MRGRQVAPETGRGGGGGVVCPGLSANTVCAGVRAVGLSSVKLRLLCSQVLKELLGQGIDYEKILKLTADTKFESGDVKATVAVLSFILSSAAKHSVDGESLSSELQQLGLPKEHAASLCRCYEEKQSPLQKHLRVCSLRKLKQAQTLMSSLG
ncbi:COMM domain-containing protein 4 isoform X8 [Theropithecus gelada]|uniref:COMM domain-containing protein 4 isoform X8 n=1 Tax=Theropithecus gelada TaxID=9565 RepID=UPI000DC16AEA|nr:COMM domain-containing protein 4 isoform X8 [Theropithecus gelada]